MWPLALTKHHRPLRAGGAAAAAATAADDAAAAAAGALDEISQGN